MSCVYCDDGELFHCESVTSSSYETDESISLAIDREGAAMTVRTWTSDDEFIDADFDIVFCPFCGERLAPSGL